MNCLLCTGSYKIEVDLESTESELNEKKFGRAFNLFCKLLRDDKHEVGEEGGGDNNHSKVKGIPCCGECNNSLLELVKLQELIESAQAKQKDILDSLKLVVLGNERMNHVTSDDPWAPLRSQLINSLNVAPDEDDTFEEEMEFEGNGEEPFIYFKVGDVDITEAEPETYGEDIISHVQGQGGMTPANNHLQSGRSSSSSLFSCHLCPKQFGNNTKLKYHLERHDPNRKSPFACPHCPRRFLTRRGAKYHIEQHRKNLEGKNSFSTKCPICFKECCQKSDLRKHMKFVHKQDQESLLSDDSNSSSNFILPDIEQPSPQPTPPPPPPPLIEAPTTSRKIYESGRVFICTICGKCFEDQEDFKWHQRIHDERTCPLCNEVFSSKHLLKVHDQQVHKATQFKCNVCPHMFNTQKALIKHSAIHEENNQDKPTNFQCTICGESSKSFMMLRKHKRTAHPSCPKCAKIFETEAELMGHNCRRQLSSIVSS